MKTKLLFLPVLLSLLMASGCFFYPAKGVERYGVTGRVIDSETKEPISKREVTLCIDGENITKKTDKRGHFEVRPKYDWYWTWTISGPVRIYGGVTLKLCVDGYQPVDFGYIEQATGEEIDAWQDVLLILDTVFCNEILLHKMKVQQNVD